MKYNRLINNEFLAEWKAAMRSVKAANGKQLPLFAAGFS
jgi:hypothetical protein